VGLSVNEEALPDDREGEYAARLAEVDKLTDSYDHVWHERQQALSLIRADAERDQCIVASQQLTWELLLARAHLGSESMLQPVREGFGNVHEWLLTDEALDYFTTRTVSPSHHVTARVQAFLWDYGGRARRRSALGVAAAHLELARHLAASAPEREHGWLYVGDPLVRAIIFSRRANQAAVLDEAIAEALRLLAYLSDQQNFRFMIDLGAVLQECADILAADQRDWIDAQLQASADGLVSSQSYHLAQEALGMRRRFATACKRHTEFLHDIDVRLATTFLHEGDEKMREDNPLVARMAYDNAVSVLERAGGESDLLNRARACVRKSTEQGKGKLVPIMSEPVELPRAEVEAFIRSIIEAPVAECFQAFAMHPHFRLKRSEMESHYDASVKQYPLQNLFPVLEMRSGAQAFAPTDSGQSRELAVFRHAKTFFRFQEVVFLEPILDGLIQRTDLSGDAVVQHLAESGRVEADALPLISVGFERLWNRDWASALHILVPQFEDLLRQLALALGLETMRPHPAIDGVTVEATLGTLVTQLRGKVVDDFMFMVEMLFDLYGENLRNEIGHGIARIGTCTPGNAARVLQLYLFLCELKPSS
jgi:hypothetical protein